MRTEILHNGCGIWRIGADGWIMTTRGRQAEREWTTRRRLAPPPPPLPPQGRKKMIQIFPVEARPWVLNLQRVSGTYLKETEVSRCQPAQPDDHDWCEVWWREGSTGAALFSAEIKKKKSQFSNGDEIKKKKRKQIRHIRFTFWYNITHCSTTSDVRATDRRN